MPSSQDSEVTVRLNLPTDPSAPRQGRQQVKHISGAPQQVRDRVELLVSELITNSVRHCSLGPDGDIELRLRLSASGIHVEVIDQGPGFTPRKPPPPGNGSRWGLYLVDRLSDRWGVDRSRGTRTWFEIDLPLHPG